MDKHISREKRLQRVNEVMKEVRLLFIFMHFIVKLKEFYFKLYFSVLLFVYAFQIQIKFFL